MVGAFSPVIPILINWRSPVFTLKSVPEQPFAKATRLDDLPAER